MMFLTLISEQKMRKSSTGVLSLRFTFDTNPYVTAAVNVFPGNPDVSGSSCLVQIATRSVMIFQNSL
jgi:hypothetical protein